jgi:hypothetical protein
MGIANASSPICAEGRSFLLSSVLKF